jgi:hypothetical protein
MELFTDIDPKIAIEWKHADVPDIEKSHNPVRNLDAPWLYFKDTSVFRPAAIAFNASKDQAKAKKSKPKYTQYLPGTTQFDKFWEIEYERCLNGYTVGGIYIPGEYYFYLNYCRIKKTIFDPITKKERKILDFPDFTSMDYYWFLELERNENPIKFGLDSTDKAGMIAAKSRRKGWSYKNAAGCVWTYSFFRESNVIIASFEERFAKSTFKFCKDMLNFLNEYTEFRHLTITDNDKMIHSGYIVKEEGQNIVKGYNSIIQIITFHSGDSKAVGQSATRMIFEEAGTFKNLINAYTISEPLFKDGEIMIGIPIIFGTGGDMSSATRDFSEMFNNPTAYGLRGYANIYEPNSNTAEDYLVGYFIDEMWYRPGTIVYNQLKYQLVDDQGNPMRKLAEISLDAERKSKRKTNKQAYDKFITQRCKTPSEAFLQTEGTVFPSVELHECITKLIEGNRYKGVGVTPVDLYQNSKGEVHYKPILNNEKEPIYLFPHKRDIDRTGCVVIYEFPEYNADGEVYKDMYFIGHDPFGVDSETGASLGSCYVMKGYKYPHLGYAQIVAEYTARPSMKEYNRNLEMLSMFYGNAKIMFENDRGEVKPYFEKQKKLSLLANQPDIVISKAIANSTLNRVYGCSMSSPKLKAVGEQYIYDFLLEKRGLNNENEPIRNIDIIPSIGLLQELLNYNRKDNFDRVMAFMQCMIYMEEKYNTANLSSSNQVQEKQNTKFDFLLKNPRLHKTHGY